MPAATDTQTDTLVYGSAFNAYWQAGWRGILPLPPAAKTPPPPGWTGRGAPTPSYPDVHAWAQDHPDANLALRLPDGVIGLDVDAYDTKAGAHTWADLHLTCGALPPTWRTTSRDDGVSGIRLYRAPTGLAWPSIAGPGIEIIRSTHRYAIAWPSVHPDTGRTYRWINPAGAPVVGDVPTIDDLPHLPAAWVDHLTSRRQDDGQPVPKAGDPQTRAWLNALRDGLPCPRLEHATTRRVHELTTPGGAARHDVMLEATMRILGLAAEGHPGAPAALRRLRAAFLTAVAADRRPGDAATEWDRAVLGAAAQHAHTAPQPATVDPCTDPLHGLVPPAVPAPRAQTHTTSQTTPQAPQEHPVGAAAATTVHGVDADTYHALVTQEALRLHISADARALHLKERTPPAPPFDAGLLRDILARPEEPPYRVDGLIPADASTLVVAQRKTGKTTLALNIARAMLTGTPVLGRFTITTPLTGNVAFLNYEVSAAQVARWANEQAIDPHRLYLVNLRGRRNPLAHDDDTQTLADQLRARDVETVIVDPFGRAYTGTSQNDAGEVQKFLVDLDQFTRGMVGAKDLILTAHAGWNGERTRGSSALEDWADTLIHLSADNDDENDGENGRKLSYFRAVGRDVEIEEDLLHFDDLTRTLTLTGAGGKRQARAGRRASALKAAVMVYVQEHPGCSGRDIDADVDGRAVDLRAARKALVADRVLLEQPRQGRGGGLSYVVADQNPEVRPTASNCVPDAVTKCVPPSYRGDVLRDEVPNEPSGTHCTSCAQPLSLARLSMGSTLCPGCDR